MRNHDSIFSTEIAPECANQKKSRPFYWGLVFGRKFSCTADNSMLRVLSVEKTSHFEGDWAQILGRIGKNKELQAPM